MFPVIFAAGAAIAAVFLSGCSNKNNNNSHNNDNGDNVDQKNSNQIEERIKTTLEQSSLLLKKSPVGTKISVPFHCHSLLVKDRFYNLTGHEASRNECESLSLSFQGSVIEEFGNHGVECSSNHFAFTEVRVNHLIQSVFCTVTKK